MNVSLFYFILHVILLFPDAFNVRTCNQCGETGHIARNCPSQHDKGDVRPFFSVHLGFNIFRISSNSYKKESYKCQKNNNFKRITIKRKLAKY